MCIFPPFPCFIISDFGCCHPPESICLFTANVTQTMTIKRTYTSIAERLPTDRMPLLWCSLNCEQTTSALHLQQSSDRHQEKGYILGCVSLSLLPEDHSTSNVAEDLVGSTSKTSNRNCAWLLRPHGFTGTKATTSAASTHHLHMHGS